MSEERTAWGWGLASVDAAGTTLDVWYPELNLGEAPAESDRPNHNFGTLAPFDEHAHGQAEHAEPRRHLRPARQCGVDQLRPLRR